MLSLKLEYADSKKNTVILSIPIANSPKITKFAWINISNKSDVNGLLNSDDKKIGEIVSPKENSELNFKDSEECLDYFIEFLNSNKEIIESLKKRKKIIKSNDETFEYVKNIASGVFNYIISNPELVQKKDFYIYLIQKIHDPKLLDIIVEKVFYKMLSRRKAFIPEVDYSNLMLLSKCLLNPIYRVGVDVNFEEFINWFNKYSQITNTTPYLKLRNSEYFYSRKLTRSKDKNIKDKNIKPVLFRAFNFVLSDTDKALSEDSHREFLEKINYPDILVLFANIKVRKIISDIRWNITAEEYEKIMKFYFFLIKKVQNNDRDSISKEEKDFSNGNSLKMSVEIKNNEPIEEEEDTIEKDKGEIYNEGNVVSIENGESKLKITEIFEREIKPIFIKENIESFSPSSKNQKTGKKDYITEHKKKIEVGEIGEKMVLLAEKQRLSSEGAAETLISRIKRVAEEKDGLGYDILSYNIDSSPRYIEVKTTSLSPSSFYFELTSNELSMSKKYAENYYLYIVFDILSLNPRIKVIRDPFGDNSSMKLVPIKYRVNLRLIDESEDF